MKTFIIVSQYENKEDFGFDPLGYYVELDDKILVFYGDDYHYKGLDKSIGFIQGYVYNNNLKENKDYIIKYKNRDDFNECYDE
jgi:hypothetical protein